MKSKVRAGLGYGLSVAISAAVTLVSIPLIIGAAGANSWAALAVGQAIGTGAAILIGFGWGTTGPTEVAKATPSARVRIYAESLRARLILAAPVITLAILITAATSPASAVEASVNAAGFGATGLLAGWYFTGVSRPYAFLLFDTLPRVTGAAAGASAIALGAPLITFPLLQLAGITIGIAASTRQVMGPSPSSLFVGRKRSVIQVIRGQSHGVVLALVSASYAAVPAALVAIVAPAGLPAYALVDKLLRFATTAVAPVVQVLQGWVPTGAHGQIRKKIRLSLGGGITLALAGGILFLLLAPFLAGVLSHNEISPDVSVVAGFSLALAFMVLSQIVGLVCLLAVGQGKKLAAYATVSIVVGLPAIVIGGLIRGAAGAAWGLAAAELIAFLPQALLLYRVMGRTR